MKCYRKNKIIFVSCPKNYLPWQQAADTSDENTRNKSESHADNFELLKEINYNDVFKRSWLSVTFFPIKGVIRKDVRQLVPMIKPYIDTVAPFSSA